MKVVPLLALVLVTAMLAGCAQRDSTDASPTTSGSPARGTASAVTIETPMNKGLGERTNVCWSVQGSGNVAHVAIHWDDMSHASESDETFEDYNLGASYPGNQSSPDPKGYDLPGRFCTSVSMPSVNTTYYIVGHAIDRNGAPGKLSPEVTIKAVGDGIVASVDTPTGPATGAANSEVTLCWVVKGTGNVAHVAIHWDTQSHAAKADRTFADYPAGAAYPNNATSLDRNGYELSPGGTKFCTNAKLPATGQIYVVGHAIGKAGAPGVVSSEKQVTVV